MKCSTIIETFRFEDKVDYVDKLFQLKVFFRVSSKTLRPRHFTFSTRKVNMVIFIERG